MGERRANRSFIVALALLAAGAAGACGGSGAPSTSSVEVNSVAEGAEPDLPELTTEDAERRLHEAAQYLEAGNTTRARLALAPVEGHEELGAMAAYNLGVAAQMDGNGEQAVRQYQTALELDPSMAVALAALVRLELTLGDVDGAELAYQRALVASHNDYAIRAAGLEITLHRGQYERVVREAREVLLHVEDNIDAHFALAQAYHALSQSELAKLVLREAIRRAPDRPDLLLALANIQVDQENEVAAIQSLREALATAPGFVEAHNNLGALLLRARNARQAIEHLEEATRLRPDFLQAWLNLSNAYKADGRLQDAEAAIQQALERRPAYAEAYFNLGLLYLDTEFPGMTRLERLEAAIDHFNRYRTAMGPRLARGDPVEAYIDEATAALESERALGTGDAFDEPAFGDDGDGADEDGFSDDVEWEDDGFSDDVEWEDDVQWEDE